MRGGRRVVGELSCFAEARLASCELDFDMFSSYVLRYVKEARAEKAIGSELEDDEAMYCVDCGSQLPTNEKSCSNCGRPQAVANTNQLYSCRLCRFAQVVAYERDASLECHRNPPTIAIATQQKPRLLTDVGQFHQQALSIWPCVPPEAWCGEFQQK
jgi:ribosomal protein S27AE